MENKFPVGTVVRYVKDCRLFGFKQGTVGVVVSFQSKGCAEQDIEHYESSGWVAVQYLTGTDKVVYNRSWMITDPRDLESISAPQEIEDLL